MRIARPGDPAHHPQLAIARGPAGPHQRPKIVRSISCGDHQIGRHIGISRVERAVAAQPEAVALVAARHRKILAGPDGGIGILLKFERRNLVQKGGNRSILTTRERPARLPPQIGGGQRHLDRRHATQIGDQRGNVGVAHPDEIIGRHRIKRPAVMTDPVPDRGFERRRVHAPRQCGEVGRHRAHDPGLLVEERPFELRAVAGRAAACHREMRAVRDACGVGRNGCGETRWCRKAREMRFASPPCPANHGARTEQCERQRAADEPDNPHAAPPP
jgi:hypothetical protein